MRTLKDLCEEVGKYFAYSIMSADRLTTFCGGGSAYVFEPSCEREFIGIYEAFFWRGITPFVLGGGSNVIIEDGVCEVPIIRTRRMQGVAISGDEVYAECGVRVGALKKALERAGGGFGFMSGVPASVGGILRMNASAFFESTADYVKSVRVLKRAKCANNAGFCDKSRLFDVVTLSKEDINFAYRKGVTDVILGGTFCGRNESYTASEYLALRREKQPRAPSCGSVFKNGNVPSGKLIEECGLKGVRIGGAQISQIHANFIVNKGGATAKDFMTLVRLCEDKVKAKFGIVLEREFVLVKASNTREVL